MVVIYGAQGIALGAYNAIKEISPWQKVHCFLVTKSENNAATLGGICVRELSEFSLALSPEEKDNVKVLIGTPENFMEDIEKKLRSEGFYNYHRLDSMTWAKLQQQAFMKNRKFKSITEYPLCDTKPDITIYMAKFWKDKELHNTEILPDYLFPIQAGAANTNMRVADILDNAGDNISERNGNYSELTVLYWIWKNKILIDVSRGEHFYGLAHYRRFLMLDDADLGRLQGSDIDVVLPYPMPYEPNIEVHHERYLADKEWNAVLTALKELEPGYTDAFTKILKQEYMYNYNIIVARGNALAAYCEWLFPLLHRIEKINDPIGAKHPNRFIGYVGEILETLYFMHNRHGLKIAHTGCKFLL